MWSFKISGNKKGAKAHLPRPPSKIDIYIGQRVWELSLLLVKSAVKLITGLETSRARGFDIKGPGAISWLRN